MKNILAIDTASAYLSLALRFEDKAYKYFNKVGNKQSENIIPQISELLHQAGMDISQLHYIAYNQGPGSFTGLRIGLSVAIGIALGVNAKLIPVPAFAIHASQARELSGCDQVVVGIDARLNQIYFAGFDMRLRNYFIEPQLIDPVMIKLETNCVITGDGFSQYKGLLPSAINDLHIVSADYPDASHLLKLADSECFAVIDPASADLLYLRNKVALDLNEQKNKKS